SFFFRSRATTASTSVDFPVPGAPVKPATPGAPASSRRASSSSRRAGSRRSTRLIARARARTSPARKLSRTLWLFSKRWWGEVVADHHDETLGLLTRGGRRIRRRRVDDRGAEEV